MFDKLTISGVITQRQPDGTKVGIEFSGKVDVVHKTPEMTMGDVYDVVLEAEMHGNDGKSRMHLFLE